MRPDHKVAVGAIVGLTIISSMYVLNNRSFTETQKTVLMFFIILPPLQWLSILIVLLYNNTRENNTETKKTERKIEQLKTSLDSSINHLKELYEQGIISKEKYEEKCVAIEVEKINQDLKNSIEYKKLVKLFNSNILTIQEFQDATEEVKKNLTMKT